MKQPAKQNAIVKQVLAEINGMKYPDGKLPTEAELCQQFQASRQTVRKALAQLELQEIIVRRQGSGTYVKEERESGRSPKPVKLPSSVHI